MRFSTTLTKTMLRLFDAFGKVDGKLLSHIPVLVTGDAGLGFRCAVGNMGFSNMIDLTIISQDGAVLTGWLDFQKDYVIQRDAEIPSWANTISEAISTKASQICKENEYGQPEAYVSGYDGDPIVFWRGDNDPPAQWLEIANDANRTVSDRLLRFLNERPANVIRASSLTFRHANLFSKYVLSEEAQGSIEKAAEKFPSLIGPFLARKDVIGSLVEDGDVFSALSEITSADETTIRFLELLDKNGVRDGEIAAHITATIASLPGGLISAIQSTEVAESLWAAISDIVLIVRWAFCMEHDENLELLLQSRDIGAMAARIIQRDGLLHDIVAGERSYKSNFWDCSDAHDDIADITLQAFVLPHLPSWLFAPDKLAPERSSRLRSTVGANLLLWAGLQEANVLAVDWNDADDDRLGSWRNSAEDQISIERCAALLDRVMPGMPPSERAWALISGPYAMNILDSDGPRKIAAA